MKTGARTPRVLGKLDKIVAKNLKIRRGEMSQVQFSKKLRIAQSTLNRIENGQASMTLYLLESISAALGIPPFDLLKERKANKTNN